MATLEGQQFGSYRLIRLLGQGGFAEVYLGEHIYLGTQAAIKILHTHMAEADQELLLKEARTIARLVHPHIVTIHDFGVQAGVPFLAMAYAPNGTLRQRHPRGVPVSPDSIVSYVKQVAEALQFAHDQKLIHRDIKPENMLLGPQNEVLLSDFGIALLMHTSRSQTAQDAIGTVSYMAPEQLQGKPQSASDQYALAVVVYEWLTSDKLFQGSFTEIASQHLFAPPPPLRQKLPTISPLVEQVVLTALAKDPQQRFGSVRAFAAALEAANQAEPSVLFAATRVTPPPGGPVEAQISSPEVALPFAPTLVRTPPAPVGPPSTPVNTPAARQGSASAPPPVYQAGAAGASPAQISWSAPPVYSGGQRNAGGWGQGSGDRPAFPGTPEAVPPRRGGKVVVLALLVLVLIGGGVAVWARTVGSPAPNIQPTVGLGHNPTATTHLPAGSTPTQPPSAGFQAGLVTDIGGLNDRGFNQLAYAGYTTAEREFGFKDSVIQTQNQNDYVANLTTAAQSNDLVIGVGFLMQGALDQVAKQFPNKKFAIVDGCPTPPNQFSCDSLPNVTPLFFKEQEAGCLVGVVAGQMEKDGKAEVPKLLGANTIGAVGGIAVPAVDRYIAGYKFCAQQVDPGVHVVVSYSNDFANPTNCKNAATDQITQRRADIIFQVAGGCGIGALDAAAANNVFGIGVDADQNALHPESIITSAIKRVDTAVYTIIKLTENGQYPSDPANFPSFNLADDGVGYGPLNAAVPADVLPVLNQYSAQIKSGALVPPANCSPASTCASS